MQRNSKVKYLYFCASISMLCVKLRNKIIDFVYLLQIPNLSFLEALKGLPLVELYLKGNPLVNRFSDHEIYVR